MKYKRISFTVPENLLKNLDSLVKLKQKEDISASRSSVLSDLISVHVPLAE